MKKHSISKATALSLGVLAMSLLISFMVLAWTEPGSSPPGGNVAAPLWSESTDLNLDGSTWSERNITNINILSGYNDLFLKGNSTETAPVYMTGSELKFYTGGIERMKIDNTGNVIIEGGAGKLTVGTIDPIFEIDGEKYATYVSDFAGGVRMETSGIVKLENISINQLNQHQSAFIIDFDKLEKGSDLWLFWKTSNKNIDDMVVLLTSSFEGAVWYEKEGNVLVIYGDKQGGVSYRLSAPRVDFEKWGNLAEDGTLEGIRISD